MEKHSNRSLYQIVFRRIVLAGILLGMLRGIWVFLPQLSDVIGDNTFDYDVDRVRYIFFSLAGDALVGAIVGILAGLVGVILCFVFIFLKKRFHH
jgi:hypothetical protein